MAAKITTLPPVTCPPLGGESELFSNEWLEQRVAGIFRLWHMIFFCLGGVLTLVILVCCVVRVRIPRTKQDIEADFKRKKITRKFRKQLDKLTIEDTNLKLALERVSERVGNELEENGVQATNDTPATTPGSAKSLSNVAVISNSALSNAQPQTTQSSTEDEAMTSAQSARIKLRKAVVKAKQQQEKQQEQQQAQQTKQTKSTSPHG